jgi:hypothetical protein
LDYLTTHTNLSPIWCGFTPGFVIYKKGCTRLAASSDKVYQLLAHGRWFSPSTLASSTTKTGHHEIAEILLKMALNTKNQIKSTKKSRPMTVNRCIWSLVSAKLKTHLHNRTLLTVIQLGTILRTFAYLFLKLS